MKNLMIPGAIISLLILGPVAAGSAWKCKPTEPDVLGPFYKPNAPARQSVGQGLLLSGTVKSSSDCFPIGNARIEFWLVNSAGRYDDDHRAAVFSDEKGKYAFESNFPTPYYGRPPHIHIRVTAKGFRLLVTQHYPVEGQKKATLDLVLIPEREKQ